MYKQIHTYNGEFVGNKPKGSVPVFVRKERQIDIHTVDADRQIAILLVPGGDIQTDRWIGDAKILKQ